MAARTLAQQIADLAATVAARYRATVDAVSGAGPISVSRLTTQAKNLVDAVNEVRAAIPANPVTISDGTTTTSSAWSSKKVSDHVNTKVSELIGGAPPSALDTLAELANALGGDPNLAATVTNGLSNRVRVDAAQVLTDQQQLQARLNIGAVSAADVGDTSTDFVAVFNAASA